MIATFFQTLHLYTLQGFEVIKKNHIFTLICFVFFCVQVGLEIFLIKSIGLWGAVYTLLIICPALFFSTYAVLRLYYDFKVDLIYIMHVVLLLGVCGALLLQIKTQSLFVSIILKTLMCGVAAAIVYTTNLLGARQTASQVIALLFNKPRGFNSQ